VHTRSVGGLQSVDCGAAGIGCLQELLATVATAKGCSHESNQVMMAKNERRNVDV
jgi:hypothetical protein